ncbi:MAG: EAL domain-containing protein [Acidaminococcaceae bacterium]|nr:EAL domain-containing protein [Acidaminococcaceae bacterium]
MALSVLAATVKDDAEMLTVGVPADRIKLDLRFLTDAGDPEKGRIIISYMIQMVYSLGMKVITEGVETADQASFLRSQGCSEMQGYYFYKPMSVREFEKLIGIEEP